MKLKNVLHKKPLKFITNLKTKYVNFKSGLKHPVLFSSILLYLVLPILLNFLIECMELKSVIQAIKFTFTSSYVFLANTFIIILTLSVTLLLKKRHFWVTVGCVIWLIFGIANFVLLCNRVTPFTANDLFLI